MALMTAKAFFLHGYTVMSQQRLQIITNGVWSLLIFPRMKEIQTCRINAR